jgi:membrane-associated phospholipid phosphatase/predicted MFS family arabinose efflux permease
VKSRLGLGFLVAFAAAALGAGLARAVTTSYLPLLLDRIRDAPGLIGTVMLVNAVAGFAVPLVVGVWSDRLHHRGRGRRLPFIAGGSVVATLGLAAIALGSGSSYLVLAVFGAVTYVGVNAVTTAHRALIPEAFAAEDRARATSAQEVAMLVGAVVGLGVGGPLLDLAVWAPFVLAAAATPLFALPTLMRAKEPDGLQPAERRTRSLEYYLHAARRPAVAPFLLAQILWVLGYAALPAFFILFAERELGLSPSAASLWLVGFGVATGAAMVFAGRVRDPDWWGPLLRLGVLLTGFAFLAIGFGSNLAGIGAALVGAAIGFGIISAVGFPLFSALIPPGEAGGYTALFFSVRAIASAIALPTAGWAIAATGSYRTLFLFGGAVTLAAVVPLWAVARQLGSRHRLLALHVPSSRWLAGWTGLLVAVYGLTLGTGLVFAVTGLHRVDEALFRIVNSVGPGPELLYHTLNPHLPNYVGITAVAVIAAARVGRRAVPTVVAVVVGSALLAWGLLEALYAVYDRPRPEEVLPAAAINIGGRWDFIESFPSGHMAIMSALAVATSLAFPRLKGPLWAYVLLMAYSRVLFGAHFPLDTVAGIVVGYVSARATFALFVESGLKVSPAELARLPRREQGRLESPPPSCA